MKKNNYPLVWSIKCLILVFLSIIGYNSYSFPQMIRHGYSDCSSCHVSPSGGGVLTPYGRMATEELLSTWNYKNESSISHGAYEHYKPEANEEPSPIMVGGDIRHVSINQRSLKGANSSRYIKMQQEIEMAVDLDDRMTVVGTVGQYPEGDKFVKEYKRHYVLYNFNENVSVRVGKFLPAYGLNIEDHTMSTRYNLGFGEDAQSHNLEIIAKNQLGEVSLTPGVSKTTEVSETSEGRYRLVTEEKTVNLRVAVNLGEKNQAGFSAQIKQDDRLSDRNETKKQFGFFSVTSLASKLYLLNDNNWKVLNNSGPIKWHPYLFNLVGLEIIKGFHVQLYHEQKNIQNEGGGRLQWFPRPHWELSAIFEKTPLGYVGIFLFHYYL